MFVVIASNLEILFINANDFQALLIISNKCKMCGINLIIDKTFQVNQKAIEQMSEATIHRGKEFTGFYYNKTSSYQIFIAHNRLKILDLSDDANQPFSLANQKQVLVYNGEIYNHQEINKEYFSGLHFKTHSDTETLYYCLVNKQQVSLDGMFAFVFYDSETHQLTTGRDNLGIKPLYYYEDASYLIISSEINGILASGLIHPQLKPEEIKHYLRFKYADFPSTFYRDIQEFPKELTEINIKDFKKIRINQSESANAVINHTNLVDEVDNLLKNTLKQQLLADVPVGIFLSGGVDSTLLLALCKELGVQNMPSYSIVNKSDEEKYGTQDYIYARLAAKKYNSIHHELEIDDNILLRFDDYIQKLEQPIADGAGYLTWLLSEEARKSVKVVLSGAGADELFAGYNRHWAFKKYLKLGLHNNVNIRIVRMLVWLSTSYPQVIHKNVRLINKFARDITVSPQNTFENFVSLQILEHFNAFHTVWEKDKDWLKWALEWDRNNYLSLDILKITDEMSMKNNLEVRVPYLGQKIIDFVDSLSSKDIFGKGQKWILKELLIKKGGEIFTKRRKEGFGMPLGLWLKKKKWQHLVEPVLNPKHPIYEQIPYQPVQKLIEQHMDGKMDYSSELWALIILTHWINYRFG